MDRDAVSDGPALRDRDPRAGHLLGFGALAWACWPVAGAGWGPCGDGVAKRQWNELLIINKGIATRGSWPY